MKTPVLRRPSRIGAIPDLNSDEAMSRFMRQMREAGNWLLDHALTVKTGGKGGGSGATMGVDVFDTEGNVVSSIGSALIDNGAIQEQHLGQDSVPEGALQDEAVQARHIGAQVVTGDHVAGSTLKDDHIVEDRKLVLEVDTNHRPYIDFLQAGHLHKVIDNLSDGTYAKQLATYTHSGKPVIDFLDSFHLNRVIDSLPDSTYAKTLASRVSSGKPFVDMSESINLGRTLVNIADDAGSTRFAVSSIDSSRKALIDFSQAGHTNKIIDNLADSTYAKTLATRVSSGKPFIDLSESINLGRNMANIADDAGSSRFAVSAIDGARKALIDFSQGGHTNKTMDNMGDGATYGRVRLTSLTTGNVDLGLAAVAGKVLTNIADDATYKRTLLTGFTAGTNQLDLSKAATGAGTGIEGIVKADTAYLNDGAGLGASADATKTTNLPATVAAAMALGMLGDVQASIGVGTASRQVASSDGAAPYFRNQYQGECDSGIMAGTTFMPGGNQNTTASFTQCGQEWVIPNPGPTTALTIEATAMLCANSSSANDTVNVKIRISTDGGSTYTDSAQVATIIINKTSTPNMGGACQMSLSAIPTGDIHIRVEVDWGTHTSTPFITSNSSLGYRISASTNGIVGGGNLAVALPATLTASASSIFPTVSGTYSKNVNAAPGGGAPGYTPANAKTAGTGSVVAGASSLVFTISDTETTTSGGATHTTTVQTTLTDTQSYTSAAGSESGTTATLTISPTGLIPVGGLFDVVTSTPSGYVKSGAVALSGTAGTTLKYTASGSGLGALTAATINNVRVLSNSCVITGTFTLTYPPVSVSISGSDASGAALSGNSATAATQLTVNHSGGDGTATEANSKVSGGGSITVGSTSPQFTVSETGTAPGSDSGVYKSIVTDGHSNSGNASKTVNFTWRAI